MASYLNYHGFHFGSVKGATALEGYLYNRSLHSVEYIDKVVLQVWTSALKFLSYLLNDRLVCFVLHSSQLNERLTCCVLWLLCCCWTAGSGTVCFVLLS